MAATENRVHVQREIKDQVVSFLFFSSHLDGVTDDYFSRDPVGNTVSICEQLLEAAV